MERERESERDRKAKTFACWPDLAICGKGLVLCLPFRHPSTPQNLNTKLKFGV